jgi:hypothetical protein
MLIGGVSNEIKCIMKNAPLRFQPSCGRIRCALSGLLMEDPVKRWSVGNIHRLWPRPSDAQCYPLGVPQHLPRTLPDGTSSPAPSEHMAQRLALPEYRQRLAGINLAAHPLIDAQDHTRIMPRGRLQGTQGAMPVRELARSVGRSPPLLRSNPYIDPIDHSWVRHGPRQLDARLFYFNGNANNPDFQFGIKPFMSGTGRPA